MPNRINIYGTVCSNCGKFLETEKKSELQLEADKRFTSIQMQVRKYFRKIILGDTDGNKIQ